MVFFGSGKFALNLLHNLLRAGEDIQVVVTKPSLTKGSTAEQISQVAQENNLPVLTASSLNAEFTKKLEKFSLTTGVVADFAEIVPPEIIYSFPKSLLGLHPSLLPAYRGPAPVQYALLNGDTETGVTLFVLEDEIDTGPIVAQRRLPIESADNTETLFIKLAETGAELIQKTLPRWLKGEISPKAQDETQASLTKKIKKADALIDWRLTDLDVVNMVRAYYSWPVAYTFWRQNNSQANLSHQGIQGGQGAPTRLQILETAIDPDLHEAEKHHYQPGQVFKRGDNQIAVACSTGAVILKRVRLEAKNLISGQDLLNGYPQIIGAILS